jgi:aspartyl/asparaginyl beta-hydroxylase (cupin superfamily)
MNGEIPSVPITTLAGIASVTDCKFKIVSLKWKEDHLEKGQKVVVKKSQVIVTFKSR